MYELLVLLNSTETVGTIIIPHQYTIDSPVHIHVNGKRTGYSLIYYIITIISIVYIYTIVGLKCF